MARLEQLLKGIKLVKARKGEKGRPRLPVTPQILHLLRSVWLKKDAQFDNVMLWAACSLCFFGFFRSGELTSPSDHAFDNEHITFRDIAFDNRTNPTTLKVHLKASKTDPYRSGVDIYVGKTGNDLCLVVAMVNYLAKRGGKDDPLFFFRDGKFLTRENLVIRVREALTAAGLDASKYSGHSFRQGAATTALDKGVSDAVIKMLGRWKSDAYTRYIRTPRDQLAAISARLAKQ